LFHFTIPAGAVLAQKLGGGALVHYPISPLHHRFHFIRPPNHKNKRHITCTN